MSGKTEARVLKGFRDSLPEESIARSEMIKRIISVFEDFGFAPIDTPALEYTTTLLGSGSGETDKQLFRFMQGKRDVAMRFDLTIPLARYVASNFSKLTFPFRRYHIAPVWRGENPQRGRFREFMQCDIDIIGSHSPLADAEVMSAISFALDKLELKHLIRVNSRKLSNGWFEELDLSQKSAEILRALDKIDKIGPEKVKEELKDKAQITPDKIDKIFELINCQGESNQETFQKLEKLSSSHETLQSGLLELKKHLEICLNLGLSDECIFVDLSIARGLDYYTGIVFETDLKEEKLGEGLGSIASGGRYDNLVERFSNNSLAGVGASIGLDRILAALSGSSLISSSKSSTKVMLLNLEETISSYSLGIVSELRKAGVNAEIFFENSKLAQQFKYAEKKGIPFVLFTGSDEEKANTFSIKNIESGQQTKDLNREKLVESVVSAIS
jgi:histidyl-tRNA synthetase